MSVRTVWLWCRLHPLHPLSDPGQVLAALVLVSSECFSWCLFAMDHEALLQLLPRLHRNQVYWNLLHPVNTTIKWCSYRLKVITSNESNEVVSR